MRRLLMRIWKQGQAEAGEDGIDDGGDLGVVRDVELAVADDVDICLIELAEAAARARAAIDLSDLETAERESEVGIMQGNVFRQRHRQVEARERSLSPLEKR